MKWLSAIPEEIKWSQWTKDKLCSITEYAEYEDNDVD